MSHSTPTKELRIFGIGSGIILMVLGLLIRWRFGWDEKSTTMWTLLGIGGVLAVCGLAAPRVLDPIYRPWMKGAMVLGVAMTAVLMSVLFVVVVPIFSLIRLKDPLRFRHTPDGDGSYWEPHKNADPTIERFSRPF